METANKNGNKNKHKGVRKNRNETGKSQMEEGKETETGKTKMETGTEVKLE